MRYTTAWPLLSTVAPPPVDIIVRPPLPPFDPDTIDAESGAPLPVQTALREAPPAHADVRWWRGDAWGITLPGLPALPGGGVGAAQSRVLTYFLDRYGRDWEAQILRRHRENGYTHISISPQDSFAVGTSEDAYVAMAVRCREAGLFVHHLLRSKYYSSADPDLDAVNPLVERLLAEDAMQVCSPAWEMNFWSPEVVRRM